MTGKTQSVGNWIASASFKPAFQTGAASGAIAALGFISIGEIVELTAVRLFTCDDDKADEELKGAGSAIDWNPWQVELGTDQLEIRRSTSWEDCHVQWWRFRHDRLSKEILLWVEFSLVQPGTVSVQSDGLIRWQTASGDSILMQPVAGEVVAVANEKEATAVRRQLATNLRIVPSQQPAVGVSRWTGIVAVRMRCTKEGRMILAAGHGAELAQRRFDQTAADPQFIPLETQKRWMDFFEQQIPPCPETQPWKIALWPEAWYILRANQLDYATPPLAKPFGSPSKFNYPHQWLWDSGFHSIVWRWSNQPSRAQDELTNLLENPQEDGRIAHEIFYTPWKNWAEGRQGISHFPATSQPPVLAMAAEKVFERTQDEQWLRWAWPRIRDGVRWWHVARDPDRDDLAGWGNGWESGLDDSPRWDHVSRDGSSFFPVPIEATELNALLVNEWKILARLADRLSLAGEADSCRERAASIKAAMLDQLWDAQEDFFYCRDHEDTPIRIKTVGGLLGLLALDPGDPQIPPLVSHLTNPAEFWTEFPVPSVARNEPAFTPQQMWRGPTWINTNWLIIRALERLGESRIAAELAERTLQVTCAQGEPRLYEWFDPISGAALGNIEYGWSTLVIDLMMQPVKTLTAS